MSDAGTMPVADRAAAALARADGFAVPVDPEAYTGLRGPLLDDLTDELESLLAELTAPEDGGTSAAAVAARLGRCRAVRFVLEGAPADRERALPLLEEARTSALLGDADRDAAHRDLVALVGARMVWLNRVVAAGRSGQWSVDQLMNVFALGTPLAEGGSGFVEDSRLLVRLLLERHEQQMTPEFRDQLRLFGEMTDALLGGDMGQAVSGARRFFGSEAAASLPPPLRAVLPSLFDIIETGPSAASEEGEEAAPDAGPDAPDEAHHARAQLLALAEILTPGTITPQDLPGLLAELSGAPDADTGEARPAPLTSRMIAALFHVALAVRTGDMQGFREALRLMHEASAAGELDGSAHARWLRAIVPGLLIGASLTGGSLQDEDTALALLEELSWDEGPVNGIEASLRLSVETARLNTRLKRALDSGDEEALEDVVDAACELELDDAFDDAEEWTGAQIALVLSVAYLGRVVLGTAAGDRTDHLRAAAHHMQRAAQTSVDMPVMRGLLDATWAPLITLTAIVESDPGRIAEGVSRARAALETPGFTSDFRPWVRRGIAIALDTLHGFTRDPRVLDEAIAELEQARAELPDGGQSGARVHWDLAELRARRATVRAGTPGADDDLRAAVDLARTSLRLAADDVLLQQGVGRGLRIAREAADRGRKAAFWALRAGRTQEAIACLEAGRSLVLGAAAVSAGVADRLAALGESELAERWRTAAFDHSWDGTDASAWRPRSAADPATTGPGGDPGAHSPPAPPQPPQSLNPPQPPDPSDPLDPPQPPDPSDLLDPPQPPGTAGNGGARRGSPLDVLAGMGMGTPGLPGDVRRRSLDVLRGQGGAHVRPVTASVDDLREGLRASAADALLYLVPGVEGADGAVLVVTRDRPAESLPLPGLAPDGRGPVAEYLAAGAHLQRLDDRSGDTTGPEERGRARRRWLHALDGMCSWAGAVLGPALDHLGVWDRALAEAGLPGAAAADERPDAVRLVLVPCGDLGVVPWQAAVLRPPGGYGAPGAVRACEVAVLTHAASGREFLRAAARRRMAPAGRPALVFHALDDLEWAEEEIDTLADVLYPQAVVYRPDAEPATPATVLALLGGLAADPASLVHIACHGLAGPDPTRSALRLAAPAGEPHGSGDLTLSTLLETPAEGDAFRSAGPLVVCGGCETDLTTRDHDEALTVTSVLVHRLAADAIGTRWRVEDQPSEILMLVLHDALARGLAPPDALRAAQRWMLTSPDERTQVRTLAGIAARRLTEDLRARPDTWAAFVHQGNPAPAAVPARRLEPAGRQESARGPESAQGQESVRRQEGEGT
ncbi:CHAT domain-containing protein [Streptomyces sp. 5-8]|uniref:CHAT domain-containing protein n=1 Tax=Streptomyces musisoli TaxID=2802280 RepID=A0ABS1NTK4_9ACTN|nr:CHAT domain-containing protein [Streptomyces musisoli]MBL1103429.1 CHAT domain-containing protein [Streptomyces musisoli]